MALEWTLKDIALPAPIGGGFMMEDYWVWCGSVVKGEDGKYHMFASRWSREYPMHPGWLAHSEVVRAESKTPEGPYEFKEVVLPERGARFWDGRSTHNPHIKKIDSKYVLYYTGMTYPFEEPEDKSLITHDSPIAIASRASKRIGIAVSDSVKGPWKRFDKPILDVRPEGFDSFLVSNPAPCVNDDGSVIMIYKSRSYNDMPYADGMYGSMQLGICRSASYDGEYIRLKDSPLFEGMSEVEDPFIWHDDTGYHMMAKDMQGKICGEWQGGVYAHSDDCINWKFRMNSVFYSRDILWDDGVMRRMANLERPFLLFEDGVPTHAFFATGEGENDGCFSKLKRTWNMVIPLKV